jgi:hypothetical protein
MRLRKSIATIAMFLFIGLPAYGRHTHGGPRPYYGGGHHTTSHGGHYQGGRNSHHKGGHYRNSRTNNRYGRHK